MRKLVTLRQIAAINPIPGADAIEVATVDGWQVVVKKGEYSVGQIVVYFEIDSVLPAGRPEFEFLMARSRRINPVIKKDETYDVIDGHRLRTIKLRGQVSQGLIIPLNERDQLLHSPQDGHSVLFYIKEDSLGEYYDRRTMEDDLSDIFGVEKYEKQVPAHLAGLCRGNYPGWLPKTDQERVQNLRDLPDGPYIYEEKMEGSSMTVYHDSERLGVTSRNLDLIIEQEGNTFVDVAKASGLFAALEAFHTDYPEAKVAIRGELIGPSIQGNIYQLSKHRFHIFDVWIDNRYLTVEERFDFLFDYASDCNHEVVDCARVMGTINPSELGVAGIVELANGNSQLYPTPREGLVFKSVIIDRHGNVPSFKAISPEYLLKEK